ncbi:patatin-like phospholipase family protein [Niallia taxi]|uniref:patatin-like phospholipase family protein n=1 Tax=Niallia taxi TaxID=2499688 RepID=UPI003D2DE523
MKRPKIGLALGSGGARGFAHIGVIKILKEANIPIDYIAGSSIGSIVASLYAAGSDIDRLYFLSKFFKRKYYLDFTLPRMGFIAGNKVKELIHLFTYGKNIEELDIPIAIVATDLSSGEKVVFKKGPIAEAVRASISIPGIFVPEKMDGRLLVDGGVIDRIPVSVVKEMGADLIIAVDVANVDNDAEIGSIYDVIMRSIDIMQRELVNNREVASDFMIRPQVEMFNSKAFTDLEKIIERGEEEARHHINSIQKEIAKWKKGKKE